MWTHIFDQQSSIVEELKVETHFCVIIIYLFNKNFIKLMGINLQINLDYIIGEYYHWKHEIQHKY